jgi:hypothetical protein
MGSRCGLFRKPSGAMTIKSVVDRWPVMVSQDRMAWELSGRDSAMVGGAFGGLHMSVDTVSIPRQSTDDDCSGASRSLGTGRKYGDRDQY